jgi:hypothetical protein
LRSWDEFGVSSFWLLIGFSFAKLEQCFRSIKVAAKLDLNLGVICAIIMSSFLNQKLGQTFGQTVQSLGQQSNVELRVGSHTLIVKERVAEGTPMFHVLILFSNLNHDIKRWIWLC